MMRRLACWDAGLGIRGMLLALSGLMMAIVALGVLSRTQPGIAVGLAGLLLVTIPLAFPRLSLALLVMIVPIQGLWGLSRDDMALLLGTLMAAVSLRHAGLWRDLLRQRPWTHLPPLLLVLAAFVVLFVGRSLFSLPSMAADQTEITLMACAFVILLFGAALAVFHHCGGENGKTMRLGLIGAVFLALALTLIFDVVAVYLPGLSNRLGLLPEWPGLRLSGLHVNPNATAKYLLAGLAFAIAALWRLSRSDESSRAPRTPLAWRPLLAALALAAICAVAVGATSSKSSLIAAFVAPMAAAVAFWPLSRRAALAAVASAMAIAVMVLGYNMVLASGLAKWTVRQHLAVEQIKPPPFLDKEPAELAERLRAQMRLSRSHEMIIEAPPEDESLPQDEARPEEKPEKHSQMYRNIEGKITYTERKCTSLICTGQRDRLWSTGFGIVVDHWLVGIGPTNWQDEYLQRTRFPFDSPHNILIEMGGGFGLLGLALYGAFLVVMWRLWRSTFAQPETDTVLAIFSRGAMLYAIALMVTEWVDPAKFFAVNPHALWVWLLLAGTVQARTAPRPATGHPAATAAERP